MQHFSQIAPRVCTSVFFIINIFKKGDREDPGNYRGITLLSVVGKVFCKILNNRLVQCLDKEGALHEGQAGFRLNRGCMDNVYTLSEIVQGRLREDKKTFEFFLDIQTAYDTVWHDSLWYKLWNMGVRGGCGVLSRKCICVI